MYWARKIKNSILSAKKYFPALLITGPRQSGKTTFLKTEFSNTCFYTTFDDPLERQFAQSDPNGFLDQFKSKPVILDEIQYVPELFSYLKIRIDNDRERNGWWLMTGSLQFQLMKNISDSLAGRICIHELLPFSFLEIKSRYKKSIKENIWYGGYPSVATVPEQRDLWLKSYFQTCIERDVRQIQQIKNLRLFETFIGLCAANHSQILNHAQISRKCGISQPACKDWLTILEGSFIVKLLQ